MPTVYEGRVFSVEVDTIQFPNGSKHQVEVVRHRPSVVLLPVPEADRVILVRQYRASIGRHTWELPAGGLNEHESPEQAAARECEEEIGLVPQKLVRLRALFPAPGFCDEELIFYRAFGLEFPSPDSPHKPDADEDIEVQTFETRRVREMVADGTIIDLKTAYGLTLL
jgi:ADP-ribose pyrophosphatase